MPQAVGRMSGYPQTTPAHSYFLPVWAVTIVSMMVSEIIARWYARMSGGGVQSSTPTIPFLNLNLLVVFILFIHGLVVTIPISYRPYPSSFNITTDTIILVTLLATNNKVRY